jgi:type I restriction enzyme, R subunit
MTNFYSEDALVERPAIALFDKLGWGTANCFDEVFGDGMTARPVRPYLGRETPAEVVLRPRLAAALARLNPDLPPQALVMAIE